MFTSCHGHIAKLEPGPRVSGSQARALACEPGCLGVRRQHPSPSPPPSPAGEGEGALACPTMTTFPGDVRCPPAVPKVHVHSPLCAPLPHPATWARFLRPTAASHAFLWSVSKSCPESLRAAPYAQHLGGKKGGWERATHLFTVPPHSGGGPIARFPVFDSLWFKLPL